jgi:hypothetical protein
MVKNAVEVAGLTVTRGRREVRRLAYLAHPGPGAA